MKQNTPRARSPKKKKAHRRRVQIRIPKRSELGAPPGTVAPPPNAVETRVQLIAYSAEQIVEEAGLHFSDLTPVTVPGVVTWINVDGVSDTLTFQQLGERFGLHSLALEDVVSLHQRPKAEDYDSHAYVVVRMPSGEEGLPLEQLSLFFGADYVLTVQEGQPGDCLGALRERIRKGRGRIREYGADYLAYAIIDAVIDHYFPVVERLNARLEAIEERLLQTPDEDTIPEIHAIRNDLHSLRRSLASTREAVGVLARGETGPVSESTQVFLRDCHDHAAQLLDAVEACRELSAGLIDLHHAAVGNRLNEVMRILTLIATIFIPLSFVAGLYGMNFNTAASPWNMPELNWALGYPFALALMLGIAVTFLLFFRSRGWLGR